MILKLDQNSIRKERIMIDIKSLNKITKFDNYSLSLQFHITSIVIDCRYINVFDAVVSF